MLNKETVYRLYSSLISGIIESNQFKYKLVAYCRKKTNLDPKDFCQETVLEYTNISLNYRSDGKLWMFVNDPSEVFVDQKELSVEGRKALNLLIANCALHSVKGKFNELVTIIDWKHLSFFSQTFSEELKRKLQQIFSEAEKINHQQ